MQVEKKVLANLTKCYSIAPLTYQGRFHFLVAAEKTDRCILFDETGKEVDTVWEGPGGVMTMVQVPGSDGQFLATHKFYSPNDSKEAKLVTVTPADGVWEVKTLAELPFVHRFDILVRNGVKYLIACTLKSGHAYKDDWSCPGKVYCAVLPDDLSTFDEAHPLPLTVLKEGLTKNHGYARTEDGGMDTAVISCENGIFQFLPPEQKNGEWEIRELLDVPASDAVLLDLDGDGGAELVVQMVAQPHQFNAVFHYGDGELSCWQYDIMEMSCRDYPLGDGAMVRQYDTGTGPNRYSNLYTVFRYLPDGETEECASLAVHQDTQEDGTEVFTYLVDDAEVDQDTFAAEFEELVGSRLLSLEDWTPATERPG